MPEEKRVDCPALRMRSDSYPFGNRVPRTVRMLRTVTADPMPVTEFSYIKRDIPVATVDQIFKVWTNSHGAVAAVLPNGTRLGLRPEEFEIETWHDLSTEATVGLVDFGFDDRTTKVTQEAYLIFLAREAASREKIDALQLRLNAADQRIDDFAGGECEWHREDDSGIWNSGCGETWSFHEDGPEENGMHFCHSCGKRLVVEVVEQEQDAAWHMIPCKQGHRDVGASGGIAACNQCDEKIEAATTQEAFEQWNASHPPAAPESAETAVN